MKKSKIVSYTSEELKQRKSQSDWAAADAMTDEEIEAAIASDPEEAALHERMMKHGRIVRPKARYVMCIDNKGHEASLTLRRVYKIIPDAKADARGWLRIVDDTERSYLFPARKFVEVQIPVEAERSFELVAA
jgi:hypothetical protein